MPDDLPGDIGTSRGEIFTPVQDTGEVLDISPAPAPSAPQQATPTQPTPAPTQPAAQQTPGASPTQPSSAQPSTAAGAPAQTQRGTGGGGPSGLTLPDKGFTKSERVWLSKLITAINTVHAIAGRNCSVSDSDGGQVINAEDCSPCP